MKTVKEVSELAGVSIRTLHYYDSIGLLHPTKTTNSGYRLYDDTALERLQHILLFRELQFPLDEIRTILSSPEFDRNKALEQQIELLQLKKEYIENLIDFARGISMIGVKTMDFSAFDTRKLDEYAEQAKATWGKTATYQEFEEKSKNLTDKDMTTINQNFMGIFVGFGQLLNLPVDEERVQAQVEQLRTFITEHFYTCTMEILLSLGAMYSGGGSMTQNIDNAAGLGTANFVSKAIRQYSENNQS